MRTLDPTRGQFTEIPKGHILNDLNPEHQLKSWKSYLLSQWKYKLAAKGAQAAFTLVSMIPAKVMAYAAEKVSRGIIERASNPPPIPVEDVNPMLAKNPQCQSKSWYDQLAKMYFYTAIQILLDQIGFVGCPRGVSHVNPNGGVDIFWFAEKQEYVDWFIQQAEENPRVLSPDFNIISKNGNGNVSYLKASDCASWCLVDSLAASMSSDSCAQLANDAATGTLISQLSRVAAFLEGAIIGSDLRMLSAFAEYSVRDLTMFQNVLAGFLNQKQKHRQGQSGQLAHPFEMFFYLRMYINMTYRHKTIDNAFMLLQRAQHQHPGRKSYEVPTTSPVRNIRSSQAQRAQFAQQPLPGPGRWQSTVHIPNSSQHNDDDDDDDYENAGANAFQLQPHIPKMQESPGYSPLQPYYQSYQNQPYQAHMQRADAFQQQVYAEQEEEQQSQSHSPMRFFYPQGFGHVGAYFGGGSRKAKKHPSAAATPPKYSELSKEPKHVPSAKAKQVPLSSAKAKQVPLSSAKAKQAPLSSAKAKQVPSSSPKAKQVPSSSPKAKKVTSAKAAEPVTKKDMKSKSVKEVGVKPTVTRLKPPLKVSPMKG